MSKKVQLIYQDCPMCGAREKWGLGQTYLANANNVEIVPTPFWAIQDKDLLMRAIKAGIKGYPFFTDGDKFAASVDAFIETPAVEIEEKPKTKRRKATLKNGASKQSN